MQAGTQAHDEVIPPVQEQQDQVDPLKKTLVDQSIQTSDDLSPQDEYLISDKQVTCFNLRGELTLSKGSSQTMELSVDSNYRVKSTSVTRQNTIVPYARPFGQELDSIQGKNISPHQG